MTVTWKQLAYDTDCVKHSLATAANDFLAASGAGAFVKKTLAQTLTILGKAAASGLASLDASSILVQAVNLLKAGTGALAATDGAVQWQSSRKIQLIYDTQRERATSAMGWLPFAFSKGYESAFAGWNPTFGLDSIALTAQFDSVATPIVLESSMLLESVSIWQTDTSLGRSWQWGLYEQYLNNGNAAENTLTKVAGCSITSFTPTAVSNETAAATGSPIYLPPGCYWLVIVNRQATRALTLAKKIPVADLLLNPNSSQTKNVGGVLPATLDFVAATWVRSHDIIAARLNGRVFGETAAY